MQRVRPLAALWLYFNRGPVHSGRDTDAAVALHTFCRSLLAAWGALC